MPIMFTCKDCIEREIGCHATCEKYINEKMEYTKVKKNKQVYQDMYNYAANRKFNSSKMPSLRKFSKCK